MRRRSPKIRRELPRRDGDEDLALARGDHLLERELALAFDGAPVAGREQAAQPPVSRAVGGIADRLEAVGGAGPGLRAGDEARSRQAADLVLLGRPMRAHHAGQRIAVGDADGGEPQLRRLPDHLVRMRRPAQEREVGGRHQLGEGGHWRPPTDVALLSPP